MCHTDLVSHSSFRTSLEGEKTKAAWLYPGPPCGVLQDAICIHRLPGRNFLRVWEIIVSISSLYVGISVPLALGFSKLYFHEGACAVSAGIQIREHREHTHKH